MDVNAELNYFGIKQERLKCVDSMFLEMLRSK
jgi:hypothetical protein